MRIYLPRTYATAAQSISLLREHADVPIEIYATHTDADSPVLTAADYREIEPDLGPDDYVGWLLDFCIRHDIEVLIATHHALQVARAVPSFEAIGVRVLVASAAGIARTEDKAAAYAWAQSAGLLVPSYRVVRTGDQLQTAFSELSLLGEVAIKPATGAGGAGFRKLRVGGPGYEELLGYQKFYERLDDYCLALDAIGGAFPMLVMPVLTGPELSVDTLLGPDGQVLTGGRIKLGRSRIFAEDGEAFEAAATIAHGSGLSYLSCTQFMYWRGPEDHSPRPYLLETNSRAAGGIYQWGDQGVSLLWLALQLLMGRDIEAPKLDMVDVQEALEQQVGALAV